MVTFVPWVNFLALALAAEDPIVTDRPDFTESSLVVGQGSTQIESGVTTTFEDDDSRSWTLPEVLVRHGLGGRAELRLGLPVYNVVRSGEGFGDVYLGAKFELGEIHGTRFALIPATFLPTGNEGFRGESASPEVKLVWSRDLEAGKSLSGMVYVASVETGGSRQTPVQHTVSLGLPLADKWGLFVEHVMDLQRRQRPQHLLHFGAVFQPRGGVQFDVHAGVGLAGGAPNAFLGAGYSVRLR